MGRAWWPVASLLVLAFLARGPLYLSVFPPFEGWDEYQHLGYIAHLDERGEIPVFDRSRVPLSLRPLVASMPHSQWGGEQVQEWGALPYAEYWKQPAPPSPPSTESTSAPRLYQAQHPPLAYVLALPVWRALGPSHRLDAIYTIRALNLLLVAGALALFAVALKRVVPPFAPRVAVLALVCLHPLFFQNVARVANDAFAVAAGIAGISVLLLADGRTLLRSGLLAAVCIAASIWGKQTGLTLIPALVLGLPAIGWVNGVPARRLVRVTAVVVAVFLALVVPLWLWSYEHYGSIVTTQESLELSARGSAIGAMLTSLPKVNWRGFFTNLFVPGTAWVGGWSFLPVSAPLATVYSWSWSAVFGIALIGGGFVLFRHVASLRGGAGALSHDGSVRLAVCAAVVALTVAGMMHHAILSHASFGFSTTNPWYFMTALPFLFVLVVSGLDAVNRRLAIVSATLLAALFVAIDLHGTWVQMPVQYAGTTDPTVQWARLSSIHPPVLNGSLRWLYLGLQLGALVLAGAAVARGARGEMNGRPLSAGRT